MCECLPCLSDIGRSAVVLADVAACLTSLSLADLESHCTHLSEEREENITQWVVKTFVRGPFKQAKKCVCKTIAFEVMLCF